MSDCLLREASGRPPVHCEETRCVFWRVAEQAGIGSEGGLGGCAIQHFELLEGGAPVAAWLMSVKDRLEGASAGAAAGGPPMEVLDARD